MKPKIVFFGSDQYSQIVLGALKNDSRFEIVEAPPTRSSPNEIRKKISDPKPIVGVLASYGKILTKEVLAIPQCGILNLHPSLLPKYRGPTPVPTAILNGENETGLSIIKMDEQVDHGPIIAQFKEEIRPDETAEELLKRLFVTGAQVLLTILPAYLEGRIEPREQDHSQATYCQSLARDSGRIDWKRPDDYQERLIRAMQPWPGAWSETLLNIKGKRAKRRLKILKAHLEKGKLILDLVQLEGKKPVTWKQFQEGYPASKLI